MDAVAAPLRIEELSFDGPAPGDVVVSVRASGVCHTDLGVLEGASPFAIRTPLVLGDEGAGVVEEIARAFAASPSARA
jgi:Zn-dependent alcohol dehydrogenase